MRTLTETNGQERKPLVAIACGGTGGHLFPGLAVAGQLIQRGCGVTLMVSPKDVDQHAVKMVSGMEIVTLPAVGLQRGNKIAFVRGFAQSFRAARTCFREKPPQAALAMGGFTSAPPILAARTFGARAYLHESNTIPGRANRWLSRVIHRAFIGFPSASEHLKTSKVTLTGTPVRPAFRAHDARTCRVALGLEPGRPVLLVMGGSQGASAINELVIRALPVFAELAPQWQWVHLTGPNQTGEVKAAYAASGLKAVVHPFFGAMELALGAASAAISRAGASSLAELAAMRVPAVLIPYPAATDNHQYENARVFEQSGAARLLEQSAATPQSLARLLLPLVEGPVTREQMQGALEPWHAPEAAYNIAETILESIVEPELAAGPAPLRPKAADLKQQTSAIG